MPGKDYTVPPRNIRGEERNMRDEERQRALEAGPPEEYNPASFAEAGELAAHQAGDPAERSKAEAVGRMLDESRKTQEPAPPAPALPEPKFTVSDSDYMQTFLDAQYELVRRFREEMRPEWASEHPSFAHETLPDPIEDTGGPEDAEAIYDTGIQDPVQDWADVQREQGLSEDEIAEMYRNEFGEDFPSDTGDPDYDFNEDMDRMFEDMALGPDYEELPGGNGDRQQAAREALRFENLRKHYEFFEPIEPIELKKR